MQETDKGAHHVKIIELLGVFMKLIFLLFISSLFGSSWANKALNIVNDDPLTEQQQSQAENYIHQGLADQKVQEFCESGQGGFKDICDEDEQGFKESNTLSKVERMLPLVAQTLSVLGATQSKLNAHVHVDGKPQYVDASGAPVEQGAEGARPATEKKHDWCATIGMVGETAAPLLLHSKNEKTQENYASVKGQAKQAASFRALAQTHNDLADGSKIQFSLWAGVSGCYAAYLAQAQFKGDTAIYFKMGLAVFMASFYKLKQNAHRKRSAILDGMASKLPQAGECNPFEDRTCFCSEESSQTSDPTNYNEFCLPKELVARNKANDASFCADAKGRIDKECKCQKTKSCIDRNLKVAAANLGFGSTVLRDPLASLRPISQGYGSSSIGSAAKRNLAIAKKALKKFKPKKKVKLTDEQKAVARALKKHGLPASISALAANQTRGGLKKAVPKNSLAGFNTNRRPANLSPGQGGPTKTAQFKKGRSHNKHARTAKRPFNHFHKKRHNSKTNSVHVEEFAAKAQAEAEINNNEERGIFDIISYRYKVRALQKSFE